MRELTRPGLILLFASAGFSVLGDATEFFGPRSPVAVTFAGLAAFAGLACLFIGRRESGGDARARLTRLSAIAWGASLVLIGVGTGIGLRQGGGAAGGFVGALGGAAFALAPVLAAWTLGARLARLSLAAGAAVVAVAYVVGAALVAFSGPRIAGLTLVGNLLLFAGYWMTVRTYRPVSSRAGASA